MKTPEIIKVLKNTRDYENLREILGNDLGQLIYDLVDASQSKPEEIDVKNAMLHVFDNFNNNLSRNEVEKRIDDYLADQTRLKPVDTKTVDAIDPTFWRRLEMFVSNIQVNDMAGEEEKQYIIHVIESKK